MGYNSNANAIPFACNELQDFRLDRFFYRSSTPVLQYTLYIRRHSVRKAFIGSREAALWAGIRAAITAHAASNRIAETRGAGSHLPTSNNCRLSSLAQPIAAGIPISKPSVTCFTAI